MTGRVGMRKPVRRRVTTVVALAATAVAMVAVAPPASAAVRPNGTYSNWTWPASSSGYYNFDLNLTVLNSASGSHYFWSHQFWLKGGQAGYLGLQTGSSPNNTKIALFSIWGANAAEGPRCGPFVENTPGYTCRLDPYNWVTGRSYRLRVWAAGADAGGDWWGAWVRDSATGVDSYVGRIRVPASWGSLDTGSVAWTENFGPLPATCSGFPWAKAQFTFPTANNGAVRISSHSHSFGGGDCPSYSRILHVPGADVQEMGKAPPAAVNLDYSSYPQLASGSSGNPVRTAQYLLLIRGHDAGTVDGIFGARTQLATRSFQSSVGLSADGVIGAHTWTALLSAGSRPTLSSGSTGADVRRLQRALTAALGRTVTIDGIFGSQTDQAVRDYQRSRGLSVDGIVGTQTWDALQHGR
jgi:peptidoglycan hydrolase-like protein with peptidoglycan-binding domain